MKSESFVARFSASFIKNFRITTLIFVSVLALGYVSYTRLLKVEGFPAVQVPVVIVESQYFVNDAEKIDDEITTPLEHAAAEIPEVTRVSSTTTPVGAFLVAEFDEDISSDKGAELLQKSVDKSVRLPEGATLEYRTINAGAFDGEHDLIFNISGDFKVEELQTTAVDLAAEIEKNDLVARAELIPTFEKQVNPITGQVREVETRINRVGYRKEDQFGKDTPLRFENAAAIGVVKNPDAGVVDLSDAIKAEVADFAKTDALDDHYVTYGGDISSGVLEQRGQLESNAIAGLIAVVVLILFLIDWRASIVGGIFIPLVFAAVFLALYVIGYSLNIISLFSLVLVLGMFVDNATVVIDAIERAKDHGHTGIGAIKFAIGNIGTSVIAGTWTTILVFIPMMFITGVLGKFIILIPVTVITALALSLFMALVIVPWLGHYFIKDKKPKQGSEQNVLLRVLEAVSHVVTKLSYLVSAFVRQYVASKWQAAAMIVITLGLIVFGGSFAAKLDFSVFPAAKDTDQIFITTSFNEGTSLEGAKNTLKKIEEELLTEFGDDLTGVTYFGADEKNALMVADLTPIDERERKAPEMARAAQEQVDDLRGARIVVRPSTVGPPVDDYQITVRVLADSTELLARGTQDVKKFLDGKELSEGERVTEVIIDRFDTLTKIDGSRYAQVRAKISDPDKTNLILELQNEITDEYDTKRLDDLGLRDDAVSIDLGQEGQNVDSFKSAVLALLIALIVMYGLLVWQFSSFTQPLLIFLAIPLSFPVLFPALYYTNNSLSFFVMLGILALAGVVVNNTIMLVDQANAYRREGRAIHDAISLAVAVRFRALLATSLTTIAGLVPLALSDPFWEPLAYAIIFGLTSSVVLVIVAFPAFYVVAERLRERVKRIHKVPTT